MAQLVSIEDAARNALAAWLRIELGDVAGIEIEPDWFEADRQLPAKAISIIDAGPRETEWLQTELAAVENVGGDKVDATWNFGFITQPVQLDLWAPTKLELSDLVARLDASLNKGAEGLGSRNAEPFVAGLLLHLGDGWEPGIADFLFGNASKTQSTTSVSESEWRATYRGRVTAQLAQAARSARLARILLKQRLRERDPADASETPELTIILPDT